MGCRLHMLHLGEKEQPTSLFPSQVSQTRVQSVLVHPPQMVRKPFLCPTVAFFQHQSLSLVLCPLVVLSKACMGGGS